MPAACVEHKPRIELPPPQARTSSIALINKSCARLVFIPTRSRVIDSFRSAFRANIRTEPLKRGKKKGIHSSFRILIHSQIRSVRLGYRRGDYEPGSTTRLPRQMQFPWQRMIHSCHRVAHITRSIDRSVQSRSAHNFPEPKPSARHPQTEPRGNFRPSIGQHMNRSVRQSILIKPF